MRDPKQNEVDGAGCLVVLGLLGLVPVLVGLSSIALMNLRSLSHSLDWTSAAAFLRSAWDWFRGGPGWHMLLKVGWLFLVGYVVLVWQWIVFLIGRRTLISPRRLWAVSSCYFAAIIFTTGFAIREVSESFGAWFMGTMWAAMIPGAFLAITLPLWLLNPRSTDESTDTRTGTREG